MAGAAAPRYGVPFPAAVLIALLVTVVVAVVLAVLRDGAAMAVVVADGVLLVAAAVAAAVFAWKATHGPNAAVWGRLAAAMAAFALAEGYWFLVEVVLARSVPALSVADAFYVLGYGLLLAALAGSVPGRWSRWLQARVGLDAVVVFASLFALGWIIFGRGMAQAGRPILAMVVASAYPALDLALLASLLFMLRTVRRVHRPRMLLFGLGLLLWTAVEVAYAAQVADAGFRSGLSIDALWAGGYIAFALAAVVRPGATGAARRGVSAKAWATAIYLPVGVLLPVAVVDYWTSRAMDPVLFGTGVVLVAALAGRQVLFTREVREGQRRLQQQAAVLEDAQAIARVGSWDYDLRSGQLSVSKETARIFAMDPAEVTYDAIMARVHPDDRARVESAFSDSVEKRRPFATEHRIVVGGRTRHVAHHGATEYDGDTPLRSVGTIQDFTERVEAEEARRFQAHLLDSVGQTVIATDLDGRITYWNAAAEQMYGWKSEEVIGQDSAELMPVPESREEALAVRALLQRGESWSGELAVRDKAGRGFLMESRVTAILDRDGRPTGFIGVAQDITARKQMASDLKERVKELRALSAIATEMATVNDTRSVLQVVVAALEPAFLHDDTWVRVQVGDQVATSDGEAAGGDLLQAAFDTGKAEGRIEVRYRGAHDREGIGPFLQEEQDLLHAVAGLLASGVRRLDAQDAVRQREAALAEAQRIARLGSWTWDPETDATTWSDMMYTIFERDPETGPAGIDEALGLFSRESRGRLQAALDDVAEEGTGYELDLEVASPSGTKHVVSRGEAVCESDQPSLLRGTVQDITQRKEAEEALRFQARLLEEVGQAVFATDLEGGVTFWNPAAERLFGWPRDQALGRSIRHVMDHEEAGASRDPDDPSADQWVRRKDGTKVLVNLATSAMVDADDRLVGFIGIAQDVTAQRTAHQRYRDIVEYSPDGIVRTTPEGALEYCNPAVADLLGYDSPQQLAAEVPRVAELYVDPDERGRLLEEVQKDDPAPIETCLTRRDGTTVWVEIRARMHDRSVGDPIIEAIVHDLTARREREELAQRLAGIVESSEEAIYSMDPEGVVQTWNPGAERLYGYTADEAVGRRFDHLIVPEDLRDHFQRNMDRLRAGHTVPRFDTVRRRNDGSLVDVSVAVMPLRDASGEVIAASVTAQDISDRKAAEEAEKARLENDYLRRLDRQLRDFINAAAHDLNQPLTPMRISLSSLEDFLKGVPDAPHRTVEILQRNIDRMALLLQDLLDVARLESGTLSFDVDDRELAPILQETEDFFERQAAEAGVTLQIDVGAGVRVMADPRRVIQVLFNLVGNALKFTPSGGRITIRGRRADGVAVVEVGDTGSGLSQDQMDRLFEAFSQVHTPSADAPKGTGLGLYISRGIVTKHGGEIGVDSDGPGKGSTFWFTLPLAAGS